jgi:hypothetical protein
MSELSSVNRRKIEISSCWQLVDNFLIIDPTYCHSYKSLVFIEISNRYKELLFSSSNKPSCQQGLPQCGHPLDWSSKSAHTAFDRFLVFQ